MTGHGGWPLNVFLTPDQAAVLRRHLLAARRRAAACRASARCSRRSPRCGASAATRRVAAGARARARGSAARATLEPSREPLDARPRSSARSPRSRESFDARNGGFGGAPKFPPHCALELLAALGEREMSDRDAARDGARRHLRPGRRRLRALRGRRDLDGPPLREDALRQRAARARLPARLAGRRRPAASSAPAARRSTSACASCARPTAASTPRSTPTPRASRAASTSGRSRELREELGALAPDGDRLLRRERARQLRGRERARGARARAGGSASEIRALLLAARAAARAPGARRQAADVLERADDRGARRRRRGARRAALPRRGGRRPRSSCWERMRDGDGPPAAHLQPRRRAPAGLPRGPRVPARGAADALRGDLRRALVRRGRASWPTTILARFADPRARRLLRHRRRRRAA